MVVSSFSRIILMDTKLEATRYKSKVNWTTLFYIINRYLPFIINVYVNCAWVFIIYLLIVALKDSFITAAVWGIQNYRWLYSSQWRPCRMYANWYSNPISSTVRQDFPHIVYFSVVCRIVLHWDTFRKRKQVRTIHDSSLEQSLTCSSHCITWRLKTTSTHLNWLTYLWTALCAFSYFSFYFPWRVVHRSVNLSPCWSNGFPILH